MEGDSVKRLFLVLGAGDGSGRGRAGPENDDDKDDEEGEKRDLEAVFRACVRAASST